MSDVQVSAVGGTKNAFGLFWVFLALGSTGAVFFSTYQWAKLQVEMNNASHQILSLQTLQQQSERDHAALTTTLTALSTEVAGWKARAALWEKSNEAWLLAQARYLIKTAEQRLHYFGELAFARQQLQEAQRCLADIHAPSVRGVKEQLARSLGALDAIKGVDFEQTWIGLTQLRASLLALPYVPPVYINASNDELTSKAVGVTVGSSNEHQASNLSLTNAWKTKMQASLEKLEGYVRLQDHHQGTPSPVLQMAKRTSALGDALVLVDLCKWSLLSYQPSVYKESIVVLQELIKAIYGQSEEGQQVLKEIERLQALNFPVLPSLANLVIAAEKAQVLPESTALAPEAPTLNVPEQSNSAGGDA